MLIYEMVAGYPPFCQEDRVAMFRAICSTDFKFPSHFSKVTCAREVGPGRVFQPRLEVVALLLLLLLLLLPGRPGRAAQGALRWQRVAGLHAAAINSERTPFTGAARPGQAPAGALHRPPPRLHERRRGRGEAASVVQVSVGAAWAGALGSRWIRARLLRTSSIATPEPALHLFHVPQAFRLGCIAAAQDQGTLRAQGGLALALSGPLLPTACRCRAAASALLQVAKAAECKRTPCCLCNRIPCPAWHPAPADLRPRRRLQL